MRSCVRDNTVWNDFKTNFQDNEGPFPILFGVFVRIFRYTPLQEIRWLADDPRFQFALNLGLNAVAFLSYIPLTLHENYKSGILLNLIVN